MSLPLLRSVAAAAVLFSLGAPVAALAHHSFAMFDSSKSVTLVGTVKEFQWTNPHTWIQVNVPTNGKVVEWSIEGGSPNGLARRGWKSSIMKPGDKITVVISPMKDGSNGGSLKSVTLPDGKVL